MYLWRSCCVFYVLQIVLAIHLSSISAFNYGISRISVYQRLCLIRKLDSSCHSTRSSQSVDIINVDAAKRPLIPSILRNLSFSQQFLLSIIFFYLNLTLFSQKVLPLPYELSPTSISCLGYDSIIGLAIIFGSIFYHRYYSFTFPSFLFPEKVPWRRPRQHPMRSLLTILAIFSIYYSLGYISPVISTFLNIIEYYIPMSEAMNSNLGVVISHFLWVLSSLIILSNTNKFFVQSKDKINVNTLINNKISKSYSNNPVAANTSNISIATNNTISHNSESSQYNENSKRKRVLRFGRLETPDFWKPKEVGGSDWMTITWRSNWLWWVVGGYSISVLNFRLASWVNDFLLPNSMVLGDNIIDIMVNTKKMDKLAIAIGFIAPCISAPWWEEIFYRGLLFPWISTFLPMPLATPLSAIIFAVHHGRVDTLLPLTVLGLTWAIIYVLSGNLFVTMIVHAMWNSRVFLGTLLGI